MTDPTLRAAPPPPRVLVVEDHEHIRKLVNASLRPLAIGVDEVSSGDAARAQMHANPGAYTLVILDIMLPGGTNGLQLCREIIERRNELGQAWPYVIVLSARAQQTDRLLASESGADLFMSKPFSPLELLSIVKANMSVSQVPG
jgi:DNA-binding response OmpR family regulator